MIKRLYFILNSVMSFARRAFDVSIMGFIVMSIFPLLLIGSNAVGSSLMTVLISDGAVYFVYIFIYLLLRANEMEHKILYRILAITVSVGLLLLYVYLSMRRLSNISEISADYYAVISICFWSLTLLVGKLISRYKLK